MTKFQNPSFNSPANSKSYVDNWDRIFKKDTTPAAQEDSGTDGESGPTPSEEGNGL